MLSSSSLRCASMLTPPLVARVDTRGSWSNIIACGRSQDDMSSSLAIPDHGKLPSLILCGDALSARFRALRRLVSDAW